MGFTNDSPQINSWCAPLDIVDPWEFYCNPVNIIKLDWKPTKGGLGFGREKKKKKTKLMQQKLGEKLPDFDQNYSTVIKSLFVIVELYGRNFSSFSCVVIGLISLYFHVSHQYNLFWEICS